MPQEYNFSGIQQRKGGLNFSGITRKGMTPEQQEFLRRKAEQQTFQSAPAVTTAFTAQPPPSTDNPLKSALAQIEKGIRRGIPSQTDLFNPQRGAEMLAAPFNVGLGALELASVPFQPAFNVVDELTGHVFPKYVEAVSEAIKQKPQFQLLRAVSPDPIKDVLDRGVETTVSIAPFVAFGGVKPSFRGIARKAQDVRALRGDIGKAVGEGIAEFGKESRSTTRGTIPVEEVAEAGIPPSFKQKMVVELGAETETRFGKVKNLSDADLARVYQDRGLDKPAPLSEAPVSRGGDLSVRGEANKAQIEKAQKVEQGRASIDAMPPEMQGAIKAEAQAMFTELQTAFRESFSPIRRAGREDPFEGGQVVGHMRGGSVSTFPDWFNKLGRNKQDVLNNLQKIIDDDPRNALAQELKKVIDDHLTQGRQVGEGFIPPDQAFIEAKSKIAGDPHRFQKTEAGEQGVMFPTQRTQEGLGGIKSEIPLSEQVKGTMFEKPKPEEPQLFGGIPRPDLRTGLSEKAFESIAKTKTGRHFLEFWSPLSTIPQSKRFLAERYKGFGDMARVERIVDNISERTRRLPDDIKEKMFRALDGQIPIEALPTEYQGTAKLMRNVSDIAGKMLVRRGIISEEAFNAHRGKYVHYMYLKHVLGEDAPIGMGQGGRLDLSIAKARKDLTTDQKKALGQIEDVSIAVPVGLSKALGDVAKHDFFKTVSENPDWTWQPSIVKVGDRKFGIGELAEEVATYDKLKKQLPGNVEVEKRYNDLKTALDDASKKAGKMPEDFEQLPNTKNWGPLRGVAVRKEIARDLKPVYDFTSAGDFGRAWGKALEFSAKSVAAFKLGKVPFNLPTVTRNVVSNFFQLNLSGIPLSDIPIWYGKALNQMIRKTPQYQQAFRNGLFKTNWSVQEIGEVLSEFKKIRSGSSLDLTRTARNLAQYYGKIDDVTKFAKFLEQTERGVSLSDAVFQAQKWGMDYSLASRSIKHARRQFIPFISYQYKILPLLAESAIERPHVIGKFALLPNLVTQYVRETEGISDQEWERLLKELPLYIRENQSFMIMPAKDAKGRFKWVNVEYFFPWGNLTSATRSASQGQVGELAQDLGIGSNPLLLLASTFVRRGNPKDPFTGRELYTDIDTPKEKVIKSLEYIYNLYAPSMLTRYGALGQVTQIGESQKFGRSVEGMDAWLRFFGVNLVTPTLEQSRANRAAIQAELRRALMSRLRDPNVTPEERQELVNRFREQVEKLGR